MLSFATTLVSQLKNANPVSFWVLKLYYNDESAFIGVSDQDRVDGSNVYHGLVSSWGTLSQSMNFFTFKTNSLNMSVKLINTEHSIQGGRFSDLLAAKNFANRKWELYQASSGYSTWDATANLIGSGVISGNIKYNTTFVDFTLLDAVSKKHKKIPTNTVTSASFGNAPKDNLNKPIPMAYGDFHDIGGIGTIFCSPVKFDYFFTKCKFPAIITNSINEDTGYVEAKADNSTLHTLDSDNIYLHNNGYYMACNTSNTTVTNPTLKYKGTSWFLYVPMNSEVANWVDGSFSTSTLITEDTGTENRDIAIPEVPNLGTVSRVDVIAKYDSDGIDMNNAEEYTVFGVDALNGGNILTTIQVQSGDGWDFGQSGHLQIRTTPSAGTVEIPVEQIGAMVTLSPSKTYSTKITTMVEKTVRNSNVIENESDPNTRDTITETVIVPRTVNQEIPADIKYIYYSGKGRKYGAWIDADSRDNGYDENGCIENPVYIIEDILRTELSLGSSNDIDYATFDAAGNATNGHIKNTLNDTVNEILFAFSQYKFINSKEFIERIGRQICSWVWMSANGKFKIRTLLRPSTTQSIAWAQDKIIDYRDITLKSISRSPIDAVRNSIVTNYDYDYGEENFKSQTSAGVDSGSNSSQSDDVEGFDQVLKLELDTDTLDTTTALNIRNAHLNCFKDRKVILDFDCLRPLYNDLEITDVIKFENWDSKIKIYGTAMGTDYYMITNISKTPFGCSIKAIKVSA